MNNSGNQIKAKMIQSYPKTDFQKLAGLETFIHHQYPDISVKVEPFMLFSKGEDEYIKWGYTLSQDEVERYLVHPPDMLLFRGDCKIAFELDGKIHDIKTEKTDKRNRRYELNRIKYIVINEADLKYKLGIPKSRPLTQEQINQEFKERLECL